MTYLEAIGKRVLVLGSPSLVLELLEKRTANTSDRPPSPLIHLYVLPHSIKNYAR